MIFDVYMYNLNTKTSQAGYFAMVRILEINLFFHFQEGIVVLFMGIRVMLNTFKDQCYFEGKYVVRNLYDL